MEVENKSSEKFLPPPELLQEYNNIYPGLGGKVFDLVNDLSRAQSDANISHVKNSDKLNSRGQNYGFILCLVLIAAATFLAYTGHDGIAGTMAGVIIVVAGTFVLRKLPGLPKIKLTKTQGSD